MMERRHPLASIIVLCHNDGAFLRGCLESVAARTKDVPHELILVNNATTDGSERYLDRLAKRRGTTVIHNRENRFFSGGNNQGLAVARGRYAVLLNADAVVGPQWLSRMIAAAERDPRAGLVAPYTNSAAGPQWIKEPGYRSMREFPAFARRWAAERDGQAVEAHRVIAFCLLVKRQVLDAVGVLDERFGPGGYEDYDYCLRVQQAGWKTVIAQDVFVHHFGGKGYAGMDYGYHRRVNREVLARKWSQFIFQTLDDMDRIAEDAAGAQAARARRPAGTGR